MVDLRDLVQKALQSNAPVTALEAVVHDHPDLPEAIGKSWADGFGTDQIPPPIARFLVDRGAKLSVHAAAGFGFTDSLADLLRGDPMLVNAKGGDGCTPLHELVERFLYERLAGGIERRSRFVEYQEPRVHQNGPRDRDALTLAAR